MTDRSATAWRAALVEPDDDVSLAAKELSERVSAPFLFNHACRTFGLASLFALIDGVPFDRQLVYVGSVLHDLGLTEAYDGPRCFENESALAAAAFARDAGWDATRCGSLANAIRLHMHPRVVPEDDDAGYLLNEATSCDVTGYRVGDLPPHAVRDVFARYPRLDFAEGFVARFERQASEKPGCLADLYLQQGLAARLREASFPI